MHVQWISAARLLRTVVLLGAGLGWQAPAVAQGDFKPAGETVDYRVGNETFSGYFSPAAGMARGTVLVIHDWDGIDDYERKRADMVSKMGFDAFAVDIYGKGNRPQETGAKKAETQRLYQDRERMRRLALAGLDVAREQGAERETVVMGYCFGGAVVLEMARNGLGDSIRGFATFHGTLATPDDQEWSDPGVPILVTHGGADTAIPMTDVTTLSRDLESVGASYEIEIYSGAPHAFTVFGTPRYQKRADEKSWDAFTDLLDTAL
ncbi:dienelactone hydrolase family protein [Guyparkeria hydrothermalis]|uniref:dienelactone hydrolase family protein n=1 Tax=Guyparkeria hydrothermalis TaxID=923 RepID=UPI00201FB94D|nr:dienelactone hydrolase family protein [Guyparkeria hydrothermalis]MCL7744432.1 dienelactone hydrolase family protein [Guyparkeria hydrothermalis]